MKEKGGKRPYTLEKTRMARYIGSQCRRKGFSNFVDFATISTTLRDFRESRLIKSGDKAELAEEDKRSLKNMRIKKEKVNPLNRGVMGWIRESFSRFWY